VKERKSNLATTTLSKLATSDPAKWSDNFCQADDNQIAAILDIHKRIAEHRRISHYPMLRKKTSAIITAYKGFLVPEIVLFKPQGEQALALKRQEFYKEKQGFLRAVARNVTENKIRLPEHASLTEKVFEEMAVRGSFDQKADEKNVFSLTVDHTAQLVTSDNFHTNFSIQARLVNFDLNTLVRLQTWDLKMRRDELAAKNYYDGVYFHLSAAGDAWPIVVLRAPYVEGMQTPFTQPTNGILYAPFRPYEEINQIKKGVIDPDRMKSKHLLVFRR
jgi:hypothetical protein